MIRCMAGPAGAYPEGAVRVVSDDEAARLAAAGVAVTLGQLVERAVAAPQPEHAVAVQPASAPELAGPSEQPVPAVTNGAIPAEMAPRVRPPRRR